MKSSSHLSMYFSPFAVKSSRPETAVKSAQSPYLKAVLSDKRPFGRAQQASPGNSSLDAALRYITNKR